VQACFAATKGRGRHPQPGAELVVTSFGPEVVGRCEQHFPNGIGILRDEPEARWPAPERSRAVLSAVCQPPISLKPHSSSKRRTALQRRREGRGGACTNRRNIEAENGRRQQSHIAEQREAAAHARIMVEHPDPKRAEQRAQSVALSRRRLGEPEKPLRNASLETGVPSPP
jgi:hypothetical protein